MSQFPSRPEPPESVVGRVTGWFRWVGWPRVVGTSVAVLAVLAAGYWLVKPPPTTTESTMPFAVRATTTTDGGSEGAPSKGDADAVDAGGGDDESDGVSTAETVVVHVTGAVDRSGVYSLPVHSRVVDAVDAAGGLSPDAQADAINLAAVVADAQRVYVPRLGEPVSAVAGVGSAAMGEPAGPIDLNTATEEQLDDLPGVGPATAAAIVAYRDQHGPFGSVDDLGNVHGIGPAKLDGVRDLVTV